MGALNIIIKSSTEGQLLNHPKYFESFLISRASQVVLVVKNNNKNLTASAGDLTDNGLIPRLGRSLEKEMATHSSILAWRNPWTEEPCGLRSIGFRRVRHGWSDLGWKDRCLNILGWGQNLFSVNDLRAKMWLVNICLNL